MPIKRLVIVFAFAAGLVNTAAVFAQSGYGGRPARGHVGERSVLRFHLDQTKLRGGGDYWPEKELDFTGSADDFEALSFTFDYQYQLTNRLSLMTSLGFYEQNHDQAYLFFEDELGNDIVHRTTLSRAAFSVGFAYYPLGRDAVVAPYGGGAVGLYGWRLRESGDFINFNTDEIFSDTFTDEAEAFGYYWLLGVEVPLGRSWALFAEGRWHRATRELGGDFLVLGSLDISSRDIGLGLSVSF